MYLIINRTLNRVFKHEGNWPGEYLDKLILDDEALGATAEVIVISLYSNTIKVPRLNKAKEVEWVDFKIPKILKLYCQMN